MSSPRPDVAQVGVTEAFEALGADADARLVDVRTKAEWTYVGVPSLTRDQQLLLEWQSFPDMKVDETFGQRLEALCPNKTAPLYFLCRSGARSLAAAREMSSRGYTRCFNVTDGFEGPPDENGHRGNKTGWKAAGLPWRQN